MLTPEQLAQMDADAGLAAPAAAGGLDPAKIAEMDAAAGIEQPSFLQRVGNDYDKRVTRLQQTADAAVAGQQSGAETVGQQALIGLGMAGDVAGEGISSLSHGAGYVLKTAFPEAATALQAAKEVVGEHLAPLAEATRAKYRQMVPENSRADRNINAAVDGVMGATAIIPAAQAVKVAAPVAVDAAAATINAAKAAPGAVMDAAGAAKKAVKTALNPELPTANEIRAEAGKAFNFAEKAGGIQAPSVRNAMLDEMQKIHPLSDEIADDDVFRATLNQLEKNRNKPLTLNAAHAIDKHLTEQINKTVDKMTGKMDATGYRLSELQDVLRDHTLRASPDTVLGGAQGYQAWAEGNRLWQKQAQMMDVENIFTRAEYAKNPKEAIQNGFATLAKNAKRMNGYDAATRADIQAAAKGSIPANFMSKMSSGLLSVVGGAVHGIPGAILGDAVNIAASKGASALQVAKANKVARRIAQDHKFVEPTAGAPPLALPAPGAGVNYYADNLGNVSRTPNPAMEVVSPAYMREIQGLPADPAAPLPPLPQDPLMLPAPDDFNSFQVDRMGNVIPAQPGADPSSFKSLQDILRMSPANARKYLNSIRGKK